MFDTQPFSGRDKIDPLEDEMLFDLPSLDAQEREAEAIIAEMDKLIERENMLAGSLDEDEIAQLRSEQEALHQRLEALAQE